MNKIIPSLFCLSLLTWSCQPGTDSSQNRSTASTQALISYFEKSPAGDTLRFEVVEGDPAATGKAIPYSVFFSQLDSSLIGGFEFLDSASTPMIIARHCTPLAGSVQACLVDIRQGWFQNQSLLLHDTLSGKISQQVTLASFYGGDGGQVLQGSWWFDYDGDGDKDIVRREIEHWLLVDGEEARDSVAERASLLVWKDGSYAPGEADAAALVRQYPIKSHW